MYNYFVEYLVSKMDGTQELAKVYFMYDDYGSDARLEAIRFQKKYGGRICEYRYLITINHNVK